MRNENERETRNLSLFSLIGDGDYKPFVSSDPDVTTVEMNGSEDFMIIACDGLWDTVNADDSATIVLDALKRDKGK